MKQKLIKESRSILKEINFRHIKTIRTQITLTPEIKKAIEAKKRLSGESLSAYLRKAALIRLIAEDEEQEELKQLAKAVIGSVSLKKHPNW